MAAHIYVRPQGRVMDRGTVFSLTIGGFPVLDSAIGNGIWMLLLAFAKLYTPHKQKSCYQHSAMTETTVKQRAFAFIMLDFKKWDSRLRLRRRFFSAVTTTCRDSASDRLAENSALD